jgi:hypothetical protein
MHQISSVCEKSVWKKEKNMCMSTFF